MVGLGLHVSNQVAVRDFEQIAYKAVDDNGAKEFSLVSRRVSLCPDDHIKKFIVMDSLKKKKKRWEITRLVQIIQRSLNLYLAPRVSEIKEKELIIRS